MHPIWIAGAASIALLVSLPVPAAAAEAGHCNVDTVLEIAPGLGLGSSSGTFTSNGSAVCFGSPAGVEASGPGTYATTGTYSGGCTGLVGEFTTRITVPTANGEMTITDRGSFGGSGAGYFLTEKTVGAYQIDRFDGDCVATPVTRAHGYGQFFFPG